MTPPEDWRPVPGYEGWIDVSSFGRARRWFVPSRRAGDGVVMLGAPVLIEPKPCFGYLQIDLRNSDGRKLVYLHRVVLEAFVGPCPRAHVACHFPDKRRRVNAADNLRWDTKAENALDRTAHRGGAAAVAERLLLLRQRAPHLRESCGDVPIGPDADASELKRMHDHWLARRRAA